MKYLFIVQGEGRGHMTQAITLSEMLRKNGHEVCEVLVGKSKNREIPDFFKEKIGARVRYFDTLSFRMKKNKKHIHLVKTILYNTTPGRIKNYLASIEKIHKRIEKTNPDVVVNFYEILCGLTNIRYRENVPFINIGHQFLLNHPDYQFGKSEEQGYMFLRLHAILNKIGATKTLALSFYPLKDYLPERIAVVPPLLRKEVTEIKAGHQEHILIYMVNHGYEEEIKEWHKKNPEVKIICFWDKKNAPAELRIDNTLSFFTINDEMFLNYMATCKGYVSTAGFESICEAFYLAKPVMVIPSHMEQEVNAADAESTGKAIANHSFDMNKFMEKIASFPAETDTFKQWVNAAEEIFIRHLTTFV